MYYEAERKKDELFLGHGQFGTEGPPENIFDFFFIVKRIEAV
jgi:hypothetical protein